MKGESRANPHRNGKFQVGSLHDARLAARRLSSAFVGDPSEDSFGQTTT